MQWTRAEFCGESGCLEAAVLPNGNVAVRNSSEPDEIPSVFTPGQWPYFLEVVGHTGPHWWFRDQDQTTFSDSEAAAFKHGAGNGDFDYDKLARIDTLD
jgi:hypothetical protein